MCFVDCTQAQVLQVFRNYGGETQRLTCILIEAVTSF
jgi:hypothetical protein